MKNVRSLNQIQRLASSKSILPTDVSGTPFHSQIQRLTSSQSSPSITLFQYSICPFCNINKALLSYSNTPYTIKEVNPLTKAEIKFSTDYKKVPIAIIEEEQINGSKNINSALLEIPSVRNNLEKKWIEKSLDSNDMDMSKFTSSNATKWNDFANEELAPILYPNICNTLSESRNAFDYVNDVKEFSKMQKIMIQGIGSIAMYFAASKIKSKRNISDERAALYDILSKWEDEGLDHGHKMFGSGTYVPDLGDLAIYGVLRSVHGLKAHEDAVILRGGTVTEWYKRMENEVQG